MRITFSIAVGILMLLFFAHPSISQDLSYEVRGMYVHPVTSENLVTAQTMSGIMPDYPSSWIMDYVSTTILLTSDGKVMQASGTNDVLSDEQKNLLPLAALGDDLSVVIDYKYRNSVTGNMDFRQLLYSATVVPDIEAAYPGGQDKLTYYLKENAISKIPATSVQQFLPAIVRFTVDEKGDIAKARIFQSSGNQKTDKLLLQVIKNMPKWEPASNSAGINVSQDFEFTVGVNGC